MGTYPPEGTGQPYAYGAARGPINPDISENTNRGVTESGVFDDTSIEPYAGGTKPSLQGDDSGTIG